ncbi:hypothetical protein ACFLSW_05680 [Candidatus Bipolaricaulota bacterium]
MIRGCLVVVIATCCLISSAATAQELWSSIPDTSGIASVETFLATCPSEEELAILQANFPILFEPAMRFRDPLYECFEPMNDMRVLSDQLVITQALRVIRHMKLEKPLPWTDLHPYEWLKSRIGAIAVSYTAQFNYCCHTVYPPDQPDGVQAISLQKASDDLLRYRRQWRHPSAGTGLGNLILLIFHEARHIDLPHNCGTNDTTMEYMGAWAVQITMARYLVEGWIDIGLPEGELPYLEWLADDLEFSRICENAG